MQLILRQDTTAPLSIATLDANNKYLEAISLASNNSMIYISSANNPIGSTFSLPFPSSGRFSGKFITGSNDGLFLSNGNQLYLHFNSIDASNVDQYVLWQTLFDNPTGKVLSVSNLNQNAIARQQSWKFRINSVTDNGSGTYSSWILDTSVLSGVNGSTFSASSKYLISWQDSSTGYGVTGPAGVTGPQGPQGPGVTSILNNTFTSSDTITITHSLGYYPIVQVLNDVYEEIIPVSITHNTVNDFTVILATSASGLVIAGAGGQGPMGPTGPGGLSIATQSVPTYSGATGQYGETRLGLSGSTPYLYVYTNQWYQFMGATF